MTDTRVSREALKVLVRTNGLASTAVSRTGVKVLMRTTNTAPAAASRAGLKVMAIRTSPAPMMVSRVALKVMIRRNPFKYYDGTTLQEARLLGWWDGATIQRIGRYTGPTT